MKRLVVYAAVLAIALARPELYKEQEDFQFSRSSSDDGTKSGFYGAQRGNMGGNYERAHNMDSLAQNQMSGLVRQVEGELGDGAQTRTGSVFTAANSRGTYGSGHFDLSNLAGRNFQEGTSYGNSQLQSSSSLSHGLASSSAHNSAAYLRSHSQSSGGARYAGYQRVNDAQPQTDDLQSLDNTQTSNAYDYGRQSSHSTGYQSNSGYQEHSEYDRSNTNLHSGYGSNVRPRLISATPVRIVITPGGRVGIPVGVQTYDATHHSAVLDQSELNSEAETLRDNQSSASRPQVKHYESSYNYRKQWEKHDNIPAATVSLVTSTESSVPRNSELYEDNEARKVNSQYDSRGSNSQSAHLSSASRRYNAVKSSSSQSRYQSNYNTQQNGDSSDLNSNLYAQNEYNTRSHGDSSDSYAAGSRHHGTASSTNLHAQTGYNAGSQTDLNSQVEDLNAKPKSYQSSYSYHKSWERQGDPYVIKPASNANYDSQLSQRLTSATKNQGYATYHTGSHYGQNMADGDCDENGHIRVARSYNTEEMEQQSVDGGDLGQQVQDTWQTLSDFDQRDNGQQSQNLEDFSQQSQANDETQNVVQQPESKWDNSQDFGQQSQANDETQNAVQQSESKWDNLQDFGQQSQSDYNQQNVEQQSQGQWESLQDLGQQSVQNWDQSADLEQQSDNHKTWNKYNDITQQQSQNFLGEHDQETVNQLENDPRNYDQHTQKGSKFEGDSNLNSHIGESHVGQVPTVEKLWGKFDFTNSNSSKITSEEQKLSVEDKNENNGFYWHQTSNIDQQTNNFEKEPDFQIINQNFHPTLEQFSNNSYEYTGLNSYSNHFANPSVYDHPLLAYQNTHQDNIVDYGPHSWHTHDESTFSTSWQQHESNIQSNSHINNRFESRVEDSPLLSVWGKLDNIEKDTLSTNIGHPEIYHKESMSTSYNNKENQNHLISETQKSQDTRQKTNTTLSTQEHENIAQSELQTVSTQAHGELELSPIAAEKKKVEIDETPGKPLDIGRGDISAEELYKEVDIVNEPYKNYDSVTQKNNNKDNMLAGSKMTILTLDAQRTKEDNYKVIARANETTDTVQNKQILPNHKNIETTNKQESLMNDMQQQNYNFNQQQDSFQETSQQQYNQYFQWQNKPDIEQQQNVKNLTKEHGDSLEQQHTDKFEQETLETIGHDHEPLEQVNLESFSQRLQDFGQQNKNEEQQYLSDFEQQNMPDYEQQSQQGINWDKFGDFEQQSVNLQQQNQFNQDYVRGHSKEHGISLEQQNIDNFEQETAQSIGQQHEPLEQVHLQSFSQSQQAFDLQKENIEQHSSNNFEQQSRNIEELRRVDIPQETQDSLRDNLQKHSEINEDSSLEVYNNTPTNIQKGSDNAKLQSAEELTPEKPGFWKSVGNKFSNAKNKIASWFTST